MTSNFRNAAGTDLDDVFYVNNSNAGAIGFKCSNGQDLGDRYPAGSLGTNVGYKNSAGTDIGYLRTKMVAPTVSIGVTQTNRWKDSWLEGPGTVDYPTYAVYAEKRVFRANVNVLNGMPISGVDWYLEYPKNPYTLVKANTSNMNDLPNKYDLNMHYTGSGYIRSNKLHTSSALYCDFTFYNKSTTTLFETTTKFVAYVYNQIGGSWISSNDVRVLDFRQ